MADNTKTDVVIKNVDIIKLKADYRRACKKYDSERDSLSGEEQDKRLGELLSYSNQIMKFYAEGGLDPAEIERRRLMAEYMNIRTAIRSLAPELETQVPAVSDTKNIDIKKLKADYRRACKKYDSERDSLSGEEQDKRLAELFQYSDKIDRFYAEGGLDPAEIERRKVMTGFNAEMQRYALEEATPIPPISIQPMIIRSNIASVLGLALTTGSVINYAVRQNSTLSELIVGGLVGVVLAIASQVYKFEKVEEFIKKKVENMTKPLERHLRHLACIQSLERRLSNAIAAENPEYLKKVLGGKIDYIQ